VTALRASGGPAPRSLPERGNGRVGRAQLLESSVTESSPLRPAHFRKTRGRGKWENLKNPFYQERILREVRGEVVRDGAERGRRCGNTKCMSGRNALPTSELPRVYEALGHFPLRDQTLVTLGLNTGFRVTELLSLNVGHVWEGDHVRSHIRVTRAKLKGGKGRRRKTITSRTVPLNETASLILQKYLFARFGSGPMKLEEPLFPSRMRGKRINRCRANEIVHEVLRRAGFRNLNAYGTHSLRKTFCQAIYRITGNDLNLTRAIMGHADCSTTQKYLCVDETEMQNAVLNLSRPRARSPHLGRRSG